MTMIGIDPHKATQTAVAIGDNIGVLLRSTAGYGAISLQMPCEGTKGRAATVTEIPVKGLRGERKC